MMYRLASRARTTAKLGKGGYQPLRGRPAAKPLSVSVGTALIVVYQPLRRRPASKTRGAARGLVFDLEKAYNKSA